MEKSQEEIEREELILRAKSRWYSQPFIKYSIVQQTKGRELCFLTKFPKSDSYKKIKKSMVRFLQCGHSEFLDMHIEAFNYLKRPFLNMYHSVSQLKDMPAFTYNLQKRSLDKEYADFVENYENYMVGYDIFFDIDNEDFKKSHKDASELKKIMEKYKLPFILNNSSSKGFHFRIPFKFISWEYKNISELVEQIKSMIYNVHVIYDIESIDTSITDLKRVCLVPYSLSQDKVILPLDDEQFESFTFDKVECWKVIRKVKLFNRGLLMRDYGLSEPELKDNLRKFYDEHKD